MQEAPFWQNVERFARFAISSIAGQHAAPSRIVRSGASTAVRSPSCIAAVRRDASSGVAFGRRIAAM